MLGEQSVAVCLPQALVIQQNCMRSSAAVPLALQFAEDSGGHALHGLLSEMLDMFLKREACYLVAGNFIPLRSLILTLTLCF